MKKNKVRKKLVLESLLAFFIAITPILWYFYKYITPNEDGNWKFLWFTLTPKSFLDVSTAMYFYFSKIILLILFIIWFSTCKHWWYHVLLIPIAMFAFQTYSLITIEDSKKIDENELLYLLGVCMVIIPVVYFIRLKLVDKHVHGIDLEAMDEELKAYREKERQQKELQEKKL